MYHYRALLLALFVNILKVKIERHLEVKLNGTTLPRSANAVLKVEVNLRSIECTVTFVYLVFDIHLVKSFFK